MDSELDLYCAYQPLNKFVEKRPAESKSLMYDNKCYVVTEQILRHVQESLSVSIGMMTPSGEVMLISPIQHSTLFTILLNHYLNERLASAALTSANMPVQVQNQPIQNPLPNTYNNHINPTMQNNSEVKYSPCWPRYAEPATQFPCCSKATSCTDFFNQHRAKKVKRDHDKDVSRRHFDLHHCPYIKRLSARKQRKLRKIFEDTDYASENDSSWA